MCCFRNVLVFLGGVYLFFLLWSLPFFIEHYKLFCIYSQNAGKELKLSSHVDLPLMQEYMLFNSPLVVRSPVSVLLDCPIFRFVSEVRAPIPVK